MRGSMGEKKFRITAGADIRHRNIFRTYSCFCENNPIRLPEIKLVFSIVFSIKKFVPVFLVKSILKFFNYIQTYFITILTDRWTNGNFHILWITAVLFCHLFYRNFSDFLNSTSPSGMRQPNRMV